MATATWCSFLGDDSCARIASSVGHNALGLLLLARADARRLRQWAEVLMGPRDANAAVPDFDAVLDAQGLAGRAREDVRRFEDLLRPRMPSCLVGRCLVDEGGDFAVSVYPVDRPGPEVRTGDAFFAGVQMYGNASMGVVFVQPHVLRLICMNGAAISASGGATFYLRRNDVDVEGDIESVLEVGFSNGLVETAESQLKRSSSIPLPAISESVLQVILRMHESITKSVLHALRSEEGTLYGLYNAITRVARDTADLRTTMRLERIAGRIVACARIETRSGTGGGWSHGRLLVPRGATSLV